MSLAEKLRVGQWVWTIASGWCKIVELNLDAESFNVIKTDEQFCWYTALGKKVAYEKSPQMYTSNPFDKDDHAPCEFKKGEVVGLSDSETEPESSYLLEVFDHYEASSDQPFIDIDGDPWKYCRKLTPTERGE